MADYSYISSNGTIVPDTGELLTDVQNEYKLAFAEDLDVTPSTPQGVLITAETSARTSVVRNNAALANQINPNLAGGIFLDAICALTALSRDAATRSTVTATLAGVSGSIIPEGVQAETTTGDIFESLSSVTLIDGEAEVIFRAVEFGAVPCAIGTLTNILTPVLGWDSITNDAAATLGQEEQSDQSLRALRKLTLAIQGVALPEAIISGLYTVPGVKSLTFRENVAATTQTIDGVEMVAHSVYACVDGGSDAEIGASLLENKSLGAAWNGDVSVFVTEPTSGQIYTVEFDRPDPIEIKVRAWVKATSLLVDPVEATKVGIMAYVNGELEGERGFVVGASVSSFELAGAVNRVTPTVYVQKLETSDDGGSTWSSNEIAIAIFEIATLDVSDITVTVI